MKLGVQPYAQDLINLLVMAVCAVLLLIYSSMGHPSKDEMMEEFLRLPAQERADFISANLTPDIILLMGITPCEKP